jgi:hypothetical protein
MAGPFPVPYRQKKTKTKSMPLNTTFAQLFPSVQQYENVQKF